MDDFSKRIANLSETKRTFLNLQLEKKRGLQEPIAIIGLACRFPRSKNPREFWNLLQNGIDAITEVPSERWNLKKLYNEEPQTPGKMNTRWGGFLEQEDIEHFDPKFFEISPRETIYMEPQQRLLLETTWEALEDAGQVPEKLKGTATGVFIGIASNDFSYKFVNNTERIDAFTNTGVAHSIAVGRLSHYFDFRGPSLAVDTACSSSLVAVHLACQSLQNGECSTAIAGGANVILAPEISIGFSQAGLLSPDGRCKSFDVRANGFVRGEGAGVVILKPLINALADGDSIYGVIRGSAVNQDGHTNGLMAPSRESQESVIRQAHRRAGVNSHEIQFIETQGTGTALGDAIEARALSAIFSNGRDQLPHTCYIGSVKTNIGHLEAAAGIAGLIKVCLALKHKGIPPNLHFQKLNPLIPSNEFPFKVPTEFIPWQIGNGRRVAGVSSFGFGGTNAHLVIDEAPDSNQNINAMNNVSSLFTLSAKSEKSLRKLAQRYFQHFRNDTSQSLYDICFTSNSGRSHFDYRLTFIAKSLTELRKKLEEYLDGNKTLDCMMERGPNKKSPKVVFIHSGQGFLYPTMVKNLYETQPAFRKALEKCQEILKPNLGYELLWELFASHNVPSNFNEIESTQSALFSLEYALAQLWLSWGIRPHAVLGYGMGQFVAACVAGILSVEDGLRLVSEWERLVKPFDKKNSTTVKSILSELDLSSQIIKNDTLQEFNSVLKKVKFSFPQIPFVSSLIGKFLEEDSLTPEYWIENIQHSENIEKSIQFLYQEGFQIFLEIGQKAFLSDLVKKFLPPGDANLILPNLDLSENDLSSKNDSEDLLVSLAQLYINGVNIDWGGFNGQYRRTKVSLPTYPFDRQRYWIEEMKGISLRPKIFGTDDLTPILSENIGVAAHIFECEIDPHSSSHLISSSEKKALIFPVSAFMKIIVAAAKMAFGSIPNVLKDTEFKESLQISDGLCRKIQIIINPNEKGESSFYIYSNNNIGNEYDPWVLHMSGKVGILNNLNALNK